MIRDELRRLEKAAKEKDKKHLFEWGVSFENQIKEDYRRQYEKAYEDEITCAISNLMIATTYTLHYSEETSLDNDRLSSFMDDLLATIDLFRTGEYKPQDYAEDLKKNGIIIDENEYNYNRIYEKYLNIFDTELVRYLKHKPRRMITIIGPAKFKDLILEKQGDLTIQGMLTYVDGAFISEEKESEFGEYITLLDQINKEKILLSDEVYVVNKDNYIDKRTQALIDYAKEHKKDIKYMEENTSDSNQV